MNKRSLQGAITPPADARLGTQVLYHWANWQKSRDFRAAQRIAVFVREGDKLVVHAYEGVCGILSVADTAPKIRQFRVWSQPFRIVQRQLVKHGWTKKSDHDLEETHHAPH